MSQTVSLFTFGCRLNQSETAVIEQGLSQDGYQVVPFGQPANIVVINTCTVTEGGESDTRRMVQKISRDWPQASIALIGCQAQIHKDRLAEWPHVKWVIGNGEKMSLAKIFKDYPSSEKVHVIAPTIERKAFEQALFAQDEDHTRANVKIQDGCDFFCSFCEIPFARGRARSRVFADIQREVRELAQKHYKEIVLTGINIGTYADSGYHLYDVIRMISEVEGIQRVRLSSIEPTTVDDRILDLMRTHKLCRYLHLPLQSGSNRILQAMKRKYTREEYQHFIEQAKAKVPFLCIGTDIIVGYPDETVEDFELSHQALREWPLDYAHIFSYSPRPHAASKDIKSLPSKIISDRSQELRQLSLRKKDLLMNALLGQEAHVIVEAPKNGQWSGLTDHYIRVKIKHASLERNQWLKVKLVSIEGQQMIGVPIDER